MKDSEPRRLDRRTFLKVAGAAGAALLGAACRIVEVPGPRTFIYPEPTPTPTKTPGEIKTDAAKAVVRSFLKATFVGGAGLFAVKRQDKVDIGWKLPESAILEYHRFSLTGIYPSARGIDRYPYSHDLSIWINSGPRDEVGAFSHLIRATLEEDPGIPELRYSAAGLIPGENLPIIVKRAFNVPEDTDWRNPPDPDLIITRYRLENGDYVTFTMKRNGSVEIVQTEYEPMVFNKLQTDRFG